MTTNKIELINEIFEKREASKEYRRSEEFSNDLDRLEKLGVDEIAFREYQSALHFLKKNGAENRVEFIKTIADISEYKQDKDAFLEKYNNWNK